MLKWYFSSDLKRLVFRQYQSLFLDFIATLFLEENLDWHKVFLGDERNQEHNEPTGHSYKTYFIGEEKSITLMESASNVDEEHGTTGFMDLMIY